MPEAHLISAGPGLEITTSPEGDTLITANGLQEQITDLKFALVFALIWIMATSFFLVFAWLH